MRRSDDPLIQRNHRIERGSLAPLNGHRSLGTAKVGQMIEPPLQRPLNPVRVTGR